MKGIKGQMDIRGLIRDEILAQNAYAVEHTACPIKLDANENPFGLDPRLQQALLQEKYLHIYPDPAQVRLREAIAAYAGVTPAQVVAGAGADELLDLVLRLVLHPGDGVVLFTPTFSYYQHLITLNHGKAITQARREDFSIDLAQAKALNLSQAKAVVLCSPNNPSGNLIEPEVLSYFLSTGILVLLDEAYYEFSGVSHLDQLGQHPNLVVFRTFSKCFALAGMRVGYCVASGELASALMRIKPPYSVNVAAEALLIQALANWPHYQDQLQELAEIRRWFYGEVAQLPGIHAYPSRSNFILCRLAKGNGKEMRDQLEQQGILVRYFSAPPLNACIRVSLGTREQMSRLLKALYPLLLE